MVIDQLTAEFVQKITANIFNLGMNGAGTLFLLGTLSNAEFLLVLPIGALCFDFVATGQGGKVFES